VEQGAGIGAKLSELGGSVNANLKYNCIENFEGEDTVGLVRVSPGRIAYSSLSDLQPNQHFISLFVQVG